MKSAQSSPGASSALRPSSMPRPEAQLPLFPERPSFASGLPIGMARGDRKFEIPAAAPTRAGYAEYLRSATWLALRLEALERDGFACRCCPSTTNLQVHHRRYPEVWGTETVEDLTTLCGRCHLIIGWFCSGDSRARMQRLRRR
jgi:hypothetical protein